MGFNLQELFSAARENPRNPMNQPGRLTGKHCLARLQRAQAKRQRAGRPAYHPAFCQRAGGAA